MLTEPDPLPTKSFVGLVSTRRVPNQFPMAQPKDYRLAIVGEAPGEDEESIGRPFVGASGKLLDKVLVQAGIDRARCFIGNVCQFRPPGNKITEFGYQHELVQQGLVELRQQLTSFKPNCVLALGNTAMWAMTGNPYGLRDSGYSISEYNAFITPSNLPGTKLVGGYHPAAVLRSYKDWILLLLAARRARQEAETSELLLPQRYFDLELSCTEACHRLDTWPSGLPCSLDIEGGLDGWLCISFVASPSSGFVVGFSEYSLSDQSRLYISISRLLYRSDVPKVLQNALYEGFVLQYGFGMVIRNIAEDTMLKQWEKYPELPKGLDTVASIWTREPQWKFLIAYSDKEKKRRAKLPDYNPRREVLNKYRACCIDSAVTLEACQAMDGALDKDAERHYRFNMRLLSPLLFMELKGFAYDKATAEFEALEVRAKIHDTITRIEARVSPMQFTKKDFTSCMRGKGGCLADARVKRVLYEQKGYPVQKKGRGENAKVTCDAEALLKLKYSRPNDPFLTDLLFQRKLESILETLEIKTDPDGRVRCAYNEVGTETGRLTCYTSPTKSGANLQTITKKLRKLYRANPGYFLFQCDLAGADGWTVAARCKSLDDPSMWDDYCAGLKPAQVVAMMFHHGEGAVRCDRAELRRRIKEEKRKGGACDPDGWLYFGCKRIHHGTDYGMQAKTMSNQLFMDSYKMTGQAVFIPESDCEVIKGLFFKRYPGIHSYHVWGAQGVFRGENLKGASGHTRVFYGRRQVWNSRSKTMEHDQETWREWLSDEPQENTTYCCNLAMERLWADTENRNEGLFLESGGETYITTRRRLPGGLIIQPMHQVHDALIGQFPIEKAEWACSKLRSYFDNTITIAGQTLVIPFEGAYGPSWGELGGEYGGGVIA